MAYQRKIPEDERKAHKTEVYLDQIQNGSDAMSYFEERYPEMRPTRKQCEELFDDKQYLIIARDLQPEVTEPEQKRYQLLHGQKLFYAAAMLYRRKIVINVFASDESALDPEVLKRFFDIDFISLSAYDKGCFLSDEIDHLKINMSAYAPKTAISYHTLQSLYSAIKTARKYPLLGKIYQEGKVNQLTVNRLATLYKSSSEADQVLITQFLALTGPKALPILDRVVDEDKSGRDKTEVMRSYIKEHYYISDDFDEDQYAIWGFDPQQARSIHEWLRGLSVGKDVRDILCLLLRDGLIQMNDADAQTVIRLISDPVISAKFSTYHVKFKWGCQGLEEISRRLEVPFASDIRQAMELMISSQNRQENKQPEQLNSNERKLIKQINSQDQVTFTTVCRVLPLLLPSPSDEALLSYIRLSVAEKPDFLSLFSKTIHSFRVYGGYRKSIKRLIEENKEKTEQAESKEQYTKQAQQMLLPDIFG